MNAIRLTAPGRLHFGLLAGGHLAGRQFGGLGLMVKEPGIAIEARRSDSWEFSGPTSDRVARVIARLRDGGLVRDPLAIRVIASPPEHVGLGTGTGLSLSVAKLVARFAGRDPSAKDLASWTGRGKRSGVGLHGFNNGGLVVDGGHKEEGDVPPLLARLAFPPDWSVLVIAPKASPGLSGEAEVRAFASLPPIPESEADRLCRLVLLGILPAVVERDLEAFGQALEEIQWRIGSLFEPVQGGIFASDRVAEVAEWLRGADVKGVGQSSWGPTLYGFSDGPPEAREAILLALRTRFENPDLGLWTTAATAGAIVHEIEDAPQSTT